MDKSKISNSNKQLNFSKKVSDTIHESSKIKVCESDENEPRKTVPMTSSICSKPEKIIR
jgi:hypothetical protein